MNFNKWILALIGVFILGAAVVAIPLLLVIVTERTSFEELGTPVVVVVTAEPLEPPVNPDATEEVIAPTATTIPTETLLPTETPLPTSTLPPTETPLPTMTFTPMPTATPLPTLTPTPIPVPCNWAQFITDVTVSNGAPIAPDTSFTKTWRLKNIGTCTWTTSYDLVFVSGTALTNNNTVVALPSAVKPGESIDLSVKLKSPIKPGDYAGYWMLEDGAGQRFGVGVRADLTFNVVIKVLNVNSDVSYDFLVNMCKAEWRNSHNTLLPCPGSSTDNPGFVTLLENPRLETRTENEPALWVHPDERTGGKIIGTFPSYKVENGDHFMAWIGCLADTKGCNVTFELKVRTPNDKVVVLGTWNETFDESITEVDVDLSEYAGQTVKLVLSVTVDNGKPEQANVFWFVPRVENLP